MRDRTEVARTIDEILIPYVECFSWGDFGSSGNPCYDPNDFPTPAEEEEAAYTLAAVQLEMEKYGTRHTDLAKKVATQTGNEYVTYPWLRDAVSRLLADTTYEPRKNLAPHGRGNLDERKQGGRTRLCGRYSAP